MTADKKTFSILWSESLIGRSRCYHPLATMLVFGCLFLMFSCATKKHVEYVDREVVKYQKEVVRDTLYQHTHDSVYHAVFQKGDTIYDTRYIEKTRWRDRIVSKTDTIYRDSVRTQFEKVTVVKTKTPKWCYYCLVVCMIFAIFAVGKILRWIQTR